MGRWALRALLLLLLPACSTFAYPVTQLPARGRVVHGRTDKPVPNATVLLHTWPTRYGRCDLAYRDDEVHLLHTDQHGWFYVEQEWTFSWKLLFIHGPSSTCQAYNLPEGPLELALGFPHQLQTTNHRGHRLEVEALPPRELRFTPVGALLAGGKGPYIHALLGAVYFLSAEPLERWGLRSHVLFNAYGAAPALGLQFQGSGEVMPLPGIDLTAQFFQPWTRWTEATGTAPAQRLGPALGFTLFMVRLSLAYMPPLQPKHGPHQPDWWISVGLSYL